MTARPEQISMGERIARAILNDEPLPYTNSEAWWKALGDMEVDIPTPIDSHSEFLQKLRTTENPDYFAVWRNEDGSWTTYRYVDGKWAIEAAAILIRAGIRLLGFEPETIAPSEKP